MDRHAQKVFLAVALGIGLGILAGRAIGGPIAWLLGAALGGASAYVLFAPIAALRAIPAAYRAARGRWPNAEQWEGFRWTLWAYLAPFTSVLAVVFAVAWFDEGPNYLTTFDGWSEIGFVVTLFGLVVGFGAAFIAEISQPDLSIRRSMHVRRFVATHTLLPVLLFWHLPRLLFWHCPRILWWTVRVAIPASARFVGRLAKQWLIIIHSDLRMLCLADAFLFAGIGTLVGGPILAWMVGGGAFGVLNYRIVSVRILKLQPVRSPE